MVQRQDDNDIIIKVNPSISTNKNIVYILTKRIIDIVFSALAIIVLTPFMLIVILAIKLESKGPVFFGQYRVGLNGKLFKMYKFRSMVSNAEELLSQLNGKNEMTGPMFKMKNDPRVTKVGRIIRKTSIDELPQLINVLKGEMSLVGPRPNLPKEVIQFSEYQKQKLIVKPGITCFWQVMGRNNIDFERWVELDIKYIKERSLWLDLKLIFRTFTVLLGDENAS